MTASNVTDLLFDQLKFRSDRQKVISSNIANLNTPDYKTKDVSFEDALSKNKDDNDLKLSITNRNHIGFDKTPSSQAQIKHFEVEGLEIQNDGNNVNLDQQISQMAQNKVIHGAISNSIKKDATWFKMILDASSKN